MDINGVNGQQPNQPTLTFTFTVAEWSVIRAALWKAPIPAELTAPIIGKLEQSLLQAQNAMSATDEVKQQQGVIQ